MDSFGLEKNNISGLNGTFMAGIQGNLTAGIFSVYGQIGVTNDTQGNKNILVTIVANFGTSAGMPVAVGADGNIIPNEEKIYYGVTELVNVGGKVEVHTGASYTFSLLELHKKSIEKIVNLYKNVFGI